MSKEVPNYAVSGGQHHKYPYLSKEQYADVKPIPEWERKPSHRTRSELLEDRRTKMRPDISYDIDNDGFVGPTDYYIARSFDKDNKGSLTSEERKECDKAVRNGFLDDRVWGLERSGVNSTSTTFQQRGVIFTNDSVEEITTSYPLPSPSATLPSKTRSQLLLDRKSQHINASQAAANLLESKSFVRGKERVVQMSNYVKDPPITRIAERAEADHQVARVAAGLFPVSSFINPVREEKALSLDYVEDPPVKTRKQLHAVRRLDSKQTILEQRAIGERTSISVDEKAELREEAAFAFRQPPDETKTLSSLKYDRKCAMIDYNAKNFSYSERPRPQFSDDPEKPWWGGEAAAHALPAAQLVDFKITQVPLRAQQKPSAPATLLAPVVTETNPVGCVKKRWTTDLIERDQLRGAPRLFDDLPNANTLAADVAPLERFSSFAVIRKNAMKEELQMKRNNLEQAVMLKETHERRRAPVEAAVVAAASVKTSGFEEI